MYLLDTNHCCKILDGDLHLVKKLESIEKTKFMTSTIVAGELFYMAYKSKYFNENLSKIEQFLRNIILLPLEFESAKIYGDIKVLLIKYYGPKSIEVRTKAKIEDIGFTEHDLWIAAVAKRYSLVVVSADNDFIRMKEVFDLNIENWLN